MCIRDRPSTFGGAELPGRAYSAATFKPREFTVKKAESLEYGVGDTVRHMKFGVGEVQDITEGGKDYEVTVDFERVGVKLSLIHICRVSGGFCQFCQGNPGIREPVQGAKGHGKEFQKDAEQGGEGHYPEFSQEQGKLAAWESLHFLKCVI